MGGFFVDYQHNSRELYSCSSHSFITTHHILSVGRTAAGNDFWAENWASVWTRDLRPHHWDVILKTRSVLWAAVIVEAADHHPAASFCSTGLLVSIAFDCPVTVIHLKGRGVEEEGQL